MSGGPDELARLDTQPPAELRSGEQTELTELSFGPPTNAEAVTPHVFSPRQLEPASSGHSFAVL